MSESERTKAREKLAKRGRETEKERDQGDAEGVVDRWRLEGFCGSLTSELSEIRKGNGKETGFSIELLVT